MPITQGQANAFLGTTDNQLIKIGEYLDNVSPKFEADGETPKANTLDDLSAHILEHYKALYTSWKRSTGPSPEF